MRIDICRFAFPVLLVCTCLCGCASQPQAHRKAGDPTTRMAGDFDREQHLRGLIAQRERAMAEVDQLDAQLDEFRRRNPDLRLVPIAHEDFSNIARALVAAKIEALDAGVKYGSGHPNVLSAQRRENELMKLYQQAFERASSLGELQDEYERLNARLNHSRELVRRLDERIAYLEDRRV